MAPGRPGPMCSAHSAVVGGRPGFGQPAQVVIAEALRVRRSTLHGVSHLGDVTGRVVGAVDARRGNRVIPDLDHRAVEALGGFFVVVRQERGGLSGGQLKRGRPAEFGVLRNSNRSPNMAGEPQPHRRPDRGPPDAPTDVSTARGRRSHDPQTVPKDAVRKRS
jgi:hypothetical protein